MGESQRAASTRMNASTGRTGIALRIFARGKVVLRPEILRSSFGIMVFALAFFHFAQFVPAAIFPLFWVDELNLTDQEISWGTALFQACVFAGSFAIGWLSQRKGNMWITVVGILALSLYPLGVALSTGMNGYLIASVIGGLAWALVGGALANYVLEMAPPLDRPAYLAWYNLALSAGILLGSMAGPILAEMIGLREAIFVAFFARALSGLAVWYAGKRVRANPPVAVQPV
jgi:MFS family permease